MANNRRQPFNSTQTEASHQLTRNAPSINTQYSGIVQYTNQSNVPRYQQNYQPMYATQQGTVPHNWSSQLSDTSLITTQAETSHQLMHNVPSINAQYSGIVPPYHAQYTNPQHVQVPQQGIAPHYQSSNQLHGAAQYINPHSTIDHTQPSSWSDQQITWLPMQQGVPYHNPSIFPYGTPQYANTDNTIVPRHRIQNSQNARSIPQYGFQLPNQRFPNFPHPSVPTGGQIPGSTMLGFYQQPERVTGTHLLEENMLSTSIAQLVSQPQALPLTGTSLFDVIEERGAHLSANVPQLLTTDQSFPPSRVSRNDSEYSSTVRVYTPPAKRNRVDDSPEIAASSYHDENDNSDVSQHSDNEDDHSQKSDTLGVVNDDILISQQPSTAVCSPAGDQFSKMYTELFSVCAEWYNLGLALGLDTGTLDAIKLTHNNKCGECLRETLKQRHEMETLTWSDVVTGLKNPTVGKITLADNINKKYVSESMGQSRSEPLCTLSASTPDCIHKYSSFLKRKYIRMSHFPDNWPPPLKEQYTKLALIERKQQVQLKKAKQAKSLEHDYVTGNVDNIIARKQETTLEQIFSLNPDSTNVKSRNFIVLMDGAPGVGKTTLTRKICIDWAKGKLLTDHQIVILKPLREMTDHTTDSLSDILQADEPELKEEVIKHIQKTSGSGVMFIFDGFDELSSEQQYNTTTQFWELIKGNKFDNCSVLVTSRSYASDPLKEINRVNQHVEVLGFKKCDIERCIKQNITDKKKAKTLIQMLKERLDIVSLCYIPLNCRIVLYVYQQLGTLPDTLTQLYNMFIAQTIKHYKKKIRAIRTQKLIKLVQEANYIEDMPAEVTKYIIALSETAYKGIDKKKVSF